MRIVCHRWSFCRIWLTEISNLSSGKENRLHHHCFCWFFGCTCALYVSLPSPTSPFELCWTQEVGGGMIGFGRLRVQHNSTSCHVTSGSSSIICFWWEQNLGTGKFLSMGSVQFEDVSSVLLLNSSSTNWISHQMHDLVKFGRSYFVVLLFSDQSRNKKIPKMTIYPTVFQK